MRPHESEWWKTLPVEEKLVSLARCRDSAWRGYVEARNTITDAVTVAERHGDVEGDQHRAWVIDQMLRALLGDNYQAWRDERAEEGLSWDEGIAP